MKNHFQEFDEKSRHFGIEKLIPYIPVSKARIEKALSEGDIHLNTIPLELWDAAAGFWNPLGRGLGAKPPVKTPTSCGKAGTPEAMRAPAGHIFYRSNVANSLADRVCVLKHVARYYVASDSFNLQNKDQ